jgi:DNA-directed RNA polymerases I, II, and III subunit RPABC1
VGVKYIKEIANRMKNEGVKRSILVVQQGMTPFAKTCLAEMQPKYHIEVVSET